MAHILLILFLIQLSSIDSLRQIVYSHSYEDVIHSKPEEISSLVKLAYEILKTNPDSSITIGLKAVELSNKYDYDEGIIEANRTVGFAYTLISNFDKAFEHFKTAETIALKTNNNRGLARIYNNFAIAYKNLGQYDKAIDYNFKSLEIKKTLPSKRDIANSYGNLGILYKNLENYTQAYSSFKMAQEIFIEIGNPALIATTYMNMASLKSLENQLDSALTLYELAIQQSQFLPKDFDHSELYTDKARLHIALNQLDHGESLLNKAYEKQRNTKNYYPLSIIHQGYSELYEAKMNWERSIEEAQKALDFARLAQNPKQESILLQVLSIRYAEKKDYKNAYFFHKKHDEIDDSLRIAENNQKILQIATDYSFREKQKELEINFERDNSKKQLVISIIIILLIASLSVLFILLLSKKKLEVAYSKVSSVNTEIAKLNNSLSDKVKERTQSLEYANEQLRQFTFNTNHQMRRPLANILGLVEIMNHTPPNDPSFFETLNMLKLASSELDTIIKNISANLEKGQFK